MQKTEVEMSEAAMAYWTALKFVMGEHGDESKEENGGGFMVLSVTASLLGSMAAAARVPEVAIRTVLGNVQLGFNSQMAHMASKNPPKPEGVKADTDDDGNYAGFTPEMEATFIELWNHLIGIGRQFGDDTLALAMAGKLCGVAIRQSDDPPAAKDVVVTNMDMECATIN